MSTPEPPEPTRQEREATPERREDEEAQRGPGHDDPENARSADE
jgi:hypothetical protein